MKEGAVDPLTLNLLTTTIVAPPSNASKWQMGFNSAFKGCMKNQQIHHVTRHNTPIHNILSTAPQLNISQKALEILPENGNVMPKYAETTTNN